MEGSAPGPASTSMNPNLQNGDGPNPIAAVPVGGATPTEGATTSPPPQQTQAPQMHPVESVLMAEMQATQASVKKAMALNRTLAMALFCVGLACIYYLSGKLKAKLPA